MKKSRFLFITGIALSVLLVGGAVFAVASWQTKNLPISGTIVSTDPILDNFDYTLTPATLDFGTNPVTTGAVSLTKTVTVANIGNKNINGLGIVVTGLPAGFTVTATTLPTFPITPTNTGDVVLTLAGTTVAGSLTLTGNVAVTPN